jgi:hypothetical protein
MDRCKKKKKKKQTRTVQKLNNKRVSRRNRTPALPYSFLLAEVARFALRNWNANRITSRQFHQKFSQNDPEIKTLHTNRPRFSPLPLSRARSLAPSLALNPFSLSRAQTLGSAFRSWRESSECTTLTCGSGVNPGDFTPLSYGSSLNPVD